MEPIVKAAFKAREKAYAPYSNYRVGAAVETEDGEIIVGCNVESSSYGLTVCAERVVLASAVAKGYRRFKRIAVSSKGDAGPCGACRQFIWDLCRNIPILMISDDGSVEELMSGDLLPRAFDNRFLKKNDE
ncbi:MAG: cytidine deaminase [Candidatus Marinimicrobia bacterium]|nr:cytidine deaminase [Candidatus Neomarinimicrobiota bacterium]|tara:strand:+ start:2332 stop:2724 length:393 start_codon:yes stop_codon:yes gene_type:complete